MRYFIFDLCLGCQGKLYVSDKDVNKLFECLNMQMIFGRFNGLWIKRHLGVQVFEFYLCKRDNKMRHVFQELNHFYI